MPRRKRLRKVVAPPGFKGFRPYGYRHGQRNHVDLLYEEYEAIKLADYDLLNHQEASELMGVSRPTFARIYESARRKVAHALVETREIRSVFGNASLDESWFICNDCHARFTIPATHQHRKCPLCRSDNVHPINIKQ
jgi:predicted DNA-binding protein (UPF0251 family)